jgi:hypothetical protein
MGLRPCIFFVKLRKQGIRGHMGSSSRWQMDKANSQYHGGGAVEIIGLILNGCIFALENQNVVKLSIVWLLLGKREVPSIQKTSIDFNKVRNFELLKISKFQ